MVQYVIPISMLLLGLSAEIWDLLGNHSSWKLGFPIFAKIERLEIIHPPNFGFRYSSEIHLDLHHKIIYSQYLYKSNISTKCLTKLKYILTYCGACLNNGFHQNTKNFGFPCIEFGESYFLVYFMTWIKLFSSLFCLQVLRAQLWERQYFTIRN